MDPKWKDRKKQKRPSEGRHKFLMEETISELVFPDCHHHGNGAQDWAGREKPLCEQRELFKIYMPLLLEFERTWWAELPSERPEKKSFTLCSTWQPQLRLGAEQSSAGTRTSGWRFSQSDAEVNDSLPSAQDVSINKAISVFIVFLTVTSAQTNCIVSNHDIQ